MYKEKIETSGKRFEKALSIRGMKQSDLCKLADIPKRSLSLYLRGATEDIDSDGSGWFKCERINSIAVTRASSGLE